MLNTIPPTKYKGNKVFLSEIRNIIFEKD